MKQMWAPWRMDFITGEKKDTGCVFCVLPKESEDRKNLILYRGKESFVIINKYPYNNGHVMIVPFQHTNDLSALSQKSLDSLMSLGRKTVDILKLAYKAEGFNLGMNLGAAGGAGIREHLHLHVVPRWNGDTNFMPVLADTKSMPQHILECYDVLFPHFEKLGVER